MMKQNYFKVIIITISILLLLTSCCRTSYQYNNLTSDEDMKEFIDIIYYIPQFFCASEPENLNLQRESLELPELLI